MATDWRPRLSIPTRIFLGFAVVLCAFGAVAATSLARHASTSATLRLLHEGYLPLALTVGEAKATQAVFGTVLDRVMSERDPTATRNWLTAARRVRPAVIRRAFFGVERAERLAPSDADRLLLAETRATLQRVRAAYDQGNGLYDSFFEAFIAEDDTRAERILGELRAHERGIDSDLRALKRALQDRVATVSAQATEQEEEAAILLAGLALVALLVGVAVIFLSHRLLAPLPLLQQRVAAVARGDLSRKLEPPRGDDELRRLARAFEDMVAALAARDARLIQSERLAAIGRMAAHVSHEVRNPLSSISLNVELLADEVGDSAEAKEILASIQREIDRLTGVTEEYLRMARLPKPHLETGDVGEVLRSVAAFVTREMEACDVNLALEVASELPAVRIDEAQLRQALLNLIRNAQEAMPDGGHVWLDANEDAGGVRISVRDDGPGVPGDEREHMFELFYTTKERGTGLGLPLTQQIVVAHGGTLTCSEGQESGTAFHLWLPAAESDPHAPEHQSDPS